MTEARLKREEVRLLKRLEMVYLDKPSGDVSLDVYRSLREGAKRDLAQIQGELATTGLDDGSSRLDPGALLELASQAGNRFKSAPAEERRELLTHLCSNCVYDQAGVQVQLRKPFDMMLLAATSTAGKGAIVDQSEKMAPPIGLEPTTIRLEGGCSIH